jgi:hypothetical protein
MRDKPSSGREKPPLGEERNHHLEKRGIVAWRREKLLPGEEIVLVTITIEEREGLAGEEEIGKN